MLFLLLLLASPAAFACGCSKPFTPEENRHSLHMFKGKVLKASTSGDYPYVQTVDFEVLERIKGPQSAVVTVTFGGKLSCDLERTDFKAGQVYLISDFAVYSSAAKDWQPFWRYQSNLCSLRELVSDGEGSPERMSQYVPAVPVSDWSTTDLFFVARNLDVTTFPNSIGPRRRPDARSLWRYGFTRITARHGIVELSEVDGDGHFTVEMLGVHGDVKELCVADRARNTRTRINVRQGKTGLFEAVAPPAQGGESC